MDIPRALVLLQLLSPAIPAIAQDSLNMRAVYRWNDTSLPSSFQHNNRYNEVWGHAAGGREYAILGSTMGTHILDVTDPATAGPVAFVPGAARGRSIIHRDFKVHAGHLYAVCDEGQSSLQVIDLRYLPDSVRLVYDSDALLRRAHNIQVDTVNARMYTCGGSSQFSVYSLDDPANPLLLMDCEAELSWWGGAIGYVHDCFVRDNVVWLNHQDGMHVVDFTDIASPRILGSLTAYPESGYNHSGWLNGDGTVYAMADETHGARLKLVDARDLSNLDVLSLVGSGRHPSSIVHNPFFDGDLLHAAWYHDGYWLWNTADPVDPVLLGWYGTSTATNTGTNYRGAWGVYPWLPSGRVLVGDMQNGLFVIDISQALGITGRAPVPEFRVWPTLTDGLVNLAATSSGTQRWRLDVLSATGALLRSEVLAGEGPFAVDLGSCADGLLLLRITGDEGSTVQRVVKTSMR